MRWLAIAFVIALPLAAVAAFAALHNDGSASPASPGAGPYHGSEPPGRILLPRFRLPTYDGKVVSSRALHGPSS